MPKKPAARKSKSKLDPGLLRAHKAYEAAINSNDTNTVNLTINAIKWATGCLL